MKQRNIIIFENKKDYIRKIKKTIGSKKSLKLIFLNTKNLKNINKYIDKADALINIPRNVFNKDLILKSKSLKWVHIGGAGIETFLFKEFVNSKILFTNGKILQGPSVSDHAIALLLLFTRNIYGQINNLKFNKLVRPTELRGKVCGVFGLGGIGQLVAEKLHSFGMEIIGFNDQLIPYSYIYKDILFFNNLQNQLKKLDVLICCAPLTNETKNFFNEKIFRKMKNGSIFINVSRGGLVQTKSFQNKKISSKFKGIGLDVTNPEPLPKNHFLRKMDNVILTHHTAGPSDFNRQRSLELMLDNLNRFLNNSNLLNLVNKVKGY